MGFLSERNDHRFVTFQKRPLDNERLLRELREMDAELRKLAEAMDSANTQLADHEDRITALEP